MFSVETTSSCCMDIPRYSHNFKTFLDNIKNANDPRCGNLSLPHSQRLLYHSNAGSSTESSAKWFIVFGKSEKVKFLGGADFQVILNPREMLTCNSPHGFRCALPCWKFNNIPDLQENVWLFLNQIAYVYCNKHDQDFKSFQTLRVMVTKCMHAHTL
jgi:hypothetical protein